MKRAKVATMMPPVDAQSPVTSERLYTITLGNSVVVRFASERRALAFQADTTRYLSDAMLATNLLLSEVYVAYRLAWPYLPEGTTGREVSCADLVHGAEKGLATAARESSNPDAVFRKWKALGDALADLRALAMQLRDLYVARTQGVQRHQMQVLVTRCGAMLQELRTYGTDVDTAHSHRPSPHATY